MQIQIIQNTTDSVKVREKSLGALVGHEGSAGGTQEVIFHF